MKHRTEQKTVTVAEETIKKIGDEDLLDNFVGVFPSNYINKFINHAAMIEDKKVKYPFTIGNTNLSEKKRHVLVEHTRYRTEKWYFFFDSFGLDDLKEFIIQDDKKTIDKILVGTEEMKRTDQKLTLC